jgi:hypothetical protein
MFTLGFEKIAGKLKAALTHSAVGAAAAGGGYLAGRYKSKAEVSKAHNTGINQGFIMALRNEEAVKSNPKAAALWDNVKKYTRHHGIKDSGTGEVHKVAGVGKLLKGKSTAKKFGEHFKKHHMSYLVGTGAAGSVGTAYGSNKKKSK